MASFCIGCFIKKIVKNKTLLETTEPRLFIQNSTVVIYAYNFCIYKIIICKNYFLVSSMFYIII